MRANHVRLQHRQVKLDDLIVIFIRRLVDFRIGDEKILVRLRETRQISPIGDVHVGDHLLIERKHRSGSPKFRAHVADRALACCANGFRAGAKILDDLVCATLHRQQAAQIENHILRRSPAAQLPGQAHAD